MKWKMLCISALICLIASSGRTGTGSPTLKQTVSQSSEYTNGGPLFKKSDLEFTYTYTINSQKEITLIFDSSNISVGDNYRFVEFLQVVPLLPAKYTFKLKVNTAEPLKDGEIYKDFYIYDFKVTFERLAI